jgi:hypothetical protein
LTKITVEYGSPLPRVLAAACTPGKHGLPGGWIPRLLCDPGGQTSRFDHALLHALGQVASTAWPVLAPMAALVLAAIVAGKLIAARRRARAAWQARWMEISCPAEAAPDGGAVLWRLLASRLASALLTPRRVIAWELHGTPDGIRAGLWVPGDVSATAVAAAVPDAWPGAQTRTGSPGLVPAPPHPEPLTAIRLHPAGPDWLPVCGLDRQASRRAQPHDADALRVVFGALAACRSAGTSLTVQILVRRASRRKLRRAGTALRHLRGLPPRRGPIHSAVLGFLDLLTTRPPKTPTRPVITPQVSDPLGPASLHALAAKAAAGPHFEVSVRIIVAGGSKATRRDLVHTAASGYGLVTIDAPVPADLAARRLWRPTHRFTSRRAPRRHWFLASLPEIATLAHLPAEPARYGLPVAMARRFPPPPEALAA